MRAVFLVLCLIAVTALAAWALFLMGRAAVTGHRKRDQQRWADAAEAAEWEPSTKTGATGAVHVTVRRVARLGGQTRVVDEAPVDRIPADCADWDTRFRTACDTARARAFELNIARTQS